jgi:hypothetical protein
MGLMDIWDWLVEQFSDTWEITVDTFSGLFSNLNEFSIPGIVGGIVCVGFIYLVRSYTITPFLKYMPSLLGRIITQFFTYIICFAAGYIFIKHAFEQ